ncbi:hypothetical protein DFJ58DRAFT_847497 [Suillus subalutaceus]|uniref:uncharacterized protein n=1 Tax=Suillus subalutaceus TaxID=48586 RepID=UPI001B8769F1|nr:uncharacterized protein DFJ58DRAFT_847497 [Suillus subalutaceus]KAG1834967.1 hypothetical protein DFJ58DRAFT_847497 [Suillus subalutaceus]
MAPPTWATAEQEAVLMSMLAEYRTYMPSKNYTQFWPKINQKFFAQWPVHKAYYPDVDDEDELTKEQKEVYKTPLKTRKKQITSWYRWQTNPACLTRSGGSRGVLDIKQTLAGGTSMKGPRAPKEVEVYSQMYYADHVKQSADDAIADSGITSCGSKLRMCREITAEKYDAESIDVKEKVKKEHRKLQKKFKKAQKAAEAREEVDDDTKIKAIHELPVMLDRIFRHLSHMTGGWKFSVLMGGRDPEAGGNMQFFDYHLGECAAGDQFAESYVMYSEILKVFASFVDSTIKYEDSLPATNCNHDRDVECSDNNSAGEGSDTEADEDRTGESTAAGIEEWNTLYQLTPNECNASQDEYNASHMELNLVSSMDGFSQASKPLDYDIDYNSLQPADYEAAMLSLLEMPSMDSEGASSHLPFLPPVEREVPVPPFIWPTPFVWPTPPTPLAFQTDAVPHGSQPPVAHTQMPTPPAPPASQPGPLAPATPRPTSPSTFEPDTAIPAPQAQPPVRTEALVPTPPATSKAPEMPKPPLAGSQTDPAVLGPQPPVTIEAPAHTPSAMPIPPAPPAFQKAPASEPCAPSASVEAPAHTPSAMPIPPAPPASQKAPASEPCAHHVEDEQPGARHTGRAR